MTYTSLQVLPTTFGGIGISIYEFGEGHTHSDNNKIKNETTGKNNKELYSTALCVHSKVRISGEVNLVHGSILAESDRDFFQLI